MKVLFIKDGCAYVKFNSSDIPYDCLGNLRRYNKTMHSVIAVNSETEAILMSNKIPLAKPYESC